MRIIFETHATSLDNEAGLASGWHDVDLSPRGEEQALQLGERRRTMPLDRIVTSDLTRAYRTAALAFPDRMTDIVRDARLRECDYGEWTRRPAGDIERVRLDHVDEPFPGGESYADCARRVRALLDELYGAGDATVLLIGHRASQYALEHLIGGVSLDEAIRRPWAWQPGWEYRVGASWKA
jgi:broad specificity phosphatase PhoE